MMGETSILQAVYKVEFMTPKSKLHISLFFFLTIFLSPGVSRVALNLFTPSYCESRYI